MKNKLFLVLVVAFISITSCTRPQDDYRTTNFGEDDTQCNRYGKFGVIVYDNITLSVKYNNPYTRLDDSSAYEFNPGTYEFCDCNRMPTFEVGRLNGYTLKEPLSSGWREHH